MNTGTTPPTSQWKQFFQEADGSFSCTRLLLVIWSLVTLGFWVIASVDSLKAQHKLAEIPPSIAALLGALATGKVVQRFSENAALKATDLNADDPFKDAADKGPPRENSKPPPD